jgi:hypothetical protein
MTPAKLMGIALVCGATAVSTASCGRSGKKAGPPTEIQSKSAVEQPNTPTTVTGCIKAGEAADTFVLTAARSTEGEHTATYQLTGTQAGQLADQVGKRVEVSGIVRAEQRTESLSTNEAAKRAKGTSGTPTVSTETDVDMRRLEVQSVKPLGDRCDM